MLVFVLGYTYWKWDDFVSMSGVMSGAGRIVEVHE
jgi:hypothetical protein